MGFRIRESKRLLGAEWSAGRVHGEQSVAVRGAHATDPPRGIDTCGGAQRSDIL